MIGHYKDPYELISIMECQPRVLNVAESPSIDQLNKKHGDVSSHYMQFSRAHRSSLFHHSLRTCVGFSERLSMDFCCFLLAANI